MFSPFLLIISFIITLLPKKKKNEKFGNFGWTLDKEDKTGVCYGEVVACVSGVEEQKKGVGMGREGKRLPLLFSYCKNTLTLPSPFLCLPLTRAKELDMSCDTVGSILIRDCSKHIYNKAKHWRYTVLISLYMFGLKMVIGGRLF